MEVTLFGMVTLVRRLLLKALSSILVVPSLISKLPVFADDDPVEDELDKDKLDEEPELHLPLL
jgi:hypothetical protein